MGADWNGVTVIEGIKADKSEPRNNSHCNSGARAGWADGYIPHRSAIKPREDGAPGGATADFHG